MAFHRRKPLYASSDDPALPPACQPFCDLKKTDGKCPPSCMQICFLTCSTPIDDFSPPPSTTTDSSDEIHYSSKNHGPSLLITIPLVIVSTIVLFLVCYTVYKLCIKRYNLRRRDQPGEPVPGPDPDAFLDEDHGPDQGPDVEHHVWYIRTVGLDPSVIGAITVVKYKKGDGLIEGTDCSVCLNGFEEDETLRLLPKCSHAFHVPCIDTWLRSHTTCPLCRAGIVNKAAVLPSSELIVQDSRPVEENLAEISRSSREGMRELGTEESGLEIRNEDDANSRAEIGLSGIQAVGRSVSMDALSASMVTAAITNASERNSDDQLVEVKELNDGIVAKRDGINQRLLRLVGSLSIERPCCIKRSLSCSANV